MSLPIETERLTLRRLRLEDAPDLLALAAHPSFSRAVPEMEPSAPGVRRYVERQLACRAFEQERAFDLAIERRADRQVIGLLTLVLRGRVGAIGWALGVGFRRQRYAVEAAAALLEYAFTALELISVEAETSVQNEPSWRLMERLGMRREARLCEATVHDGQPADSYLYTIRPDEWRAGPHVPGGPVTLEEVGPCPSGDSTQA